MYHISLEIRFGRDQDRFDERQGDTDPMHMLTLLNTGYMAIVPSN
jgi:hypothetical protein